MDWTKSKSFQEMIHHIEYAYHLFRAVCPNRKLKSHTQYKNSAILTSTLWVTDPYEMKQYNEIL